MQTRMMTFLPLLQTQRSRKQQLQQVPNNLKDLFLKIRSKPVVRFQQINTTVIQSGLKLRRYRLCYSPSIDRIYCQPYWLYSHKNTSLGTSYTLQIHGVQKV